MTKRALPAVLGFFALCLPLAAQGLDPFGETRLETIPLEQLRQTGEIDAGAALARARPDIFSTVDGAVLIHGLPVVTLLDGHRYPISGELGRMGATEFTMFPVALLQSVEVEKLNPSPMTGTDGPGGTIDLRLNRNYVGGEVGVFYGKSSGKYGREDFQAYFMGGVGNDKVNFSAGGVYQESSGRVLRH